MSHAKLAPSSAHRWLKCPGSVILKSKMPGTQIDESKTQDLNSVKGTFAHTVAQVALEHFNIEKNGNKLFDHKVVELILDRYNHRLSEEDADIYVNYVMIYINAVYKIYKATLEEYPSLKCRIFIEKRVTIIPGVCFGTADCIIFNEKQLVAIDFKTGDERVNVNNNTQLACYLRGAFNGFDQFRLPLKFVGVIVQPTNDNPVTKYEYNYKELMNLTNRISDANNKIENYEAQIDRLLIIDKEKTIDNFKAEDIFTTGDHCKYCDGLPLCEKAKDKFFNNIKNLNGITEEEMKESDIVDIIKYKKIFNNLIDRSEKFATSLLSCGFEIDGIELTQRRKNKKWKDEQALIENLPANEIALCYTTTLKSPSKMAKLFGAEFVNQYCYKPDGGMTVRLKCED